LNQSTGVNLMSKEKCPNCNGVGKVKCPKCKGIGQLHDNGSYKTCSMCSGTANATCPTCIGSGWITTPSRTSGLLINVTENWRYYTYVLLYSKIWDK